MKYWTLFGAITAAALWLCACSEGHNTNTLKVGSTAVPHAEILAQTIPLLKEKGIDLEIVIIDDYNTPNRALVHGDIDANYFQHRQFLELQQKEFGYDLEILTEVHLEPLGLYSSRIKSLAELARGSTVALPNDPTNEARALLLLEKHGLITLNRHDMNATLLNIESNPKGLKFLEVDAPLLARSLEDVDLSAINTNFALQAGLHPHVDALELENNDSPFVNIVVVRHGESGREDLKALKEALHSDQIRHFIAEHYKDAIIQINGK